MNNDINNLKYVEVPMIVLLGFCYASNKYLSNLLKVSRRTITSCISSLKRKNYIKVENDPNMRKIYLANFF